MRMLFAIVFGLCCTASFHAAQADDRYPQQPIRLIVPAAPGGGADEIARLISPILSAKLGQPVLVENKSGASGTIAGNFVAKAKPDGYTLLMAQNTSIVIAPHLYKAMPYNTLTDLAPISLVISVPNILVVNPSLPAKTVAQFIALARAHPGAYSFGSAGIGSPSHIAGEMFDKAADVKMLHVPYQGSAPAVTALLSDQIQVMFAPITAVLPLIQAKKLRALGVTTAQPLPGLHGTPAIAEAGLPGFDISSWFGLFTAAATPPEVVARINAAVVDALKDPRVSNTITQMDSVAVGNSASAFSDQIHTEDQKYAALLKTVVASVD